MLMEKFENRVYLASPAMHGEEQMYIKEAFDTNWVAPLGKNVNEFEKETAKYVGCKDAAALISGTSAIHLAIKLAGVKRGDIVLCSDLTFAATVNPVVYEGGVPVFIDSETESWNMSPKALRKAFEKYNGKELPKPKAVLVANLYGTPAKLDEIKQICDEQGVTLIEDAAESLGATINGKQTGTFGKYNILSFNGNKIITTSGGGMLLSDDEEAIKKARFWATQSREDFPWYEHKEIGYNYRLSNITAGIGRGQLIHLDEHISLKKAIYERYKTGLKDLPITMNPYPANVNPNFWLSCMLIDEGCETTPDMVREKLAEYNVESRPIWKPMHMQPVFAGSDFITDGVCVGEDIFKRGLCIPSDVKMTEEQQNIVMEIIKSCFK